LKTAVLNIASHLKPGGIFIITVPNKKVIIDRYKKNKLQNKFYKIVIDNKISKFKSYHFTLTGSVDDCVEYFINFFELKNMFEQLGIFILKRQSFPIYFKEQKKHQSALFKKMKVLCPSHDEKEVIGLYEIIVFKKKCL
jgi:mRNA (guanine-N7-)-methyltransferase